VIFISSSNSLVRGEPEQSGIGALAEGVAEGQCIGVTSGQMIAKPV